MAKEDDKKVVLPYGSTTTHGDSVSTTVRNPKYTTRTEQTVSGFLNPDGTLNTAAEEDFNLHYRDPYAQARGIDPETGKVQKKFVTDILGVDPEVMRRKRQAEEELNRSKQKEAGLYNALAVLGDMITTAGGGNVWKRNPDGKAKEARDRNLQLQQEQQAEDIANNNALRNAELSYAAAVQKMRDTYAKQFGLKQSKTVEYGGNTTTTKTQGQDQTTGYRYALNKNGNSSSSSSGGGSQWVMNINTTKADGTVSKKGYQLNQNEFEAVAGLLKAHYNTILNEKDEKGKPTVRAIDLRAKLLENHVLKKVADPMTNQIQYEYDDNQLLQNGKFWALDEGLRNRIRTVSGNKVKFQTTGWGKVPQEENYDF